MRKVFCRIFRTDSKLAQPQNEDPPLVVEAEELTHCIITVQHCRKCGTKTLGFGHKFHKSPPSVSTNGLYFDYIYWECLNCHDRIHFTQNDLNLINKYGMYNASNVILPELKIQETRKEKVANPGKRDEYTFKE